jgi:hypothetical protein
LDAAAELVRPDGKRGKGGQHSDAWAYPGADDLARRAVEHLPSPHRLEQSHSLKGNTMRSTRYVGRIAGSAVALGTGAWLASVPWLAAADDSSGLDIAGPDPAGFAPLFSDAQADPSGLNIDVSYNGMDLYHVGDAVAHTGTGDFAIAYGDGSTADAGYGETTDGLSLVGQQDNAFAWGADSTAIAGGGDGDDASATDGGTACSGFVQEIGSGATGGSNDVASASGAGSTADALGSLYNTATASDGGTADSGFGYLSGVLNVGGQYDSASASGAESTAVAGLGVGDSASASGAGDSALAAWGNSDIAEVFGEGSKAVAGGTGESALGNNDFAAVLANMLTAEASPGSNLFVIEPALFTDSAAAATAGLPTDDLGLTILFADFSWLGL